jgi:hypothetical protein
MIQFLGRDSDTAHMHRTGASTRSQAVASAKSRTEETQLSRWVTYFLGAILCFLAFRITKDGGSSVVLAVLRHGAYARELSDS